MKRKAFCLLLALLVLACCVVTGCYEKTMANPDPDPQDSRGFSGNMQRPVKIIIPKVGIDATIQSADVTKDSSVMISSQELQDGVVWYEKGASPGWDYNAILASHHDLEGLSGTFINLDKLEIGDTVEIRYEDGSIGRFVAKSTNTYHGESVPNSVTANTGPTRTTLIAGSGDPLTPSFARYSHYLVVTLVATEHIG